MTVLRCRRVNAMALGVTVALSLGCSVSFQPTSAPSPRSQAAVGSSDDTVPVRESVAASAPDTGAPQGVNASPTESVAPVTDVARPAAAPSSSGIGGEDIGSEDIGSEDIGGEDIASQDATVSPSGVGDSAGSRDATAGSPRAEVGAPEAAATVAEASAEPSAIGPRATSVPSRDAETLASPPTAPRTIKSIPSDPSVTIDLTFDDIKFDLEKGAPFQREMITDDIERYQDRTVKIRGYVLPGYQERGITEFVLVRDNMECCFGPGAAPYDCILVSMQPGTTINYTVRPVTVEGVFAIEPYEDTDGHPLAIYRLQGLSAR